nr:transposase [Rhodococcus qingshengii]
MITNTECGHVDDQLLLLQQSYAHCVCHALARQRTDNALVESFIATLKREALQGAAHWESRWAVRLAVFRWINRYVRCCSG